MPLVDVVIPSWNGLHWLKQCLPSLHGQLLLDFRVTVVDNGSTDGTTAWVQTHFPDTLLIRNPQNLGFAKAVNQGVRQGSAEYVATLNNDTEADPGWLQSLVQVAEGSRLTGMVASKMLFADRPGMINSAGICVDRAGIAWDRSGGARDDPQTTEPEEVFGPCAGAALYRRAMLDEIGLFDEDFFAYLEDVDLAWRARRAGWRCLYAPTARVLHHHSATAREGSPFKSFHLGRNKVWLLAKNYPFRQLWQHVPLVVAYDLLAATYALVSRGDRHALRGRLAALSGWRKMWRKRRHALTSRRRTDIGFLEPVASPGRITERYQHLRPPAARTPD